MVPAFIHKYIPGAQNAEGLILGSGIRKADGETPWRVQFWPNGEATVWLHEVGKTAPLRTWPTPTQAPVSRERVPEGSSVLTQALGAGQKRLFFWVDEPPATVLD